MAIAGLGRIAAADDAKVETTDDKTGTEIGVLPLVGGDTDNGFGIGAIGSIANFDGKSKPYNWQIQFAAFAATKSSPFAPSYEDAFANIIFPQLLDGLLRLEVRPAFTHESALRYYGLGNNVKIPDQTDDKRDFYTRLHPQLDVTTRWRLSESWFVLGGASFLYNDTSYDPSSTLAMQIPMIDHKADQAHGIVKLSTGVVYDTRDNEIAPNSGMFHTLAIAASPAISDSIPYKYEQFDLQLRYYRTLLPKRMVLALRVVGDELLGDVPFYELARYGNTSAIGGGLAVRGVIGYAFYGKVKVFGNVELRTHITNFNFWDKKYKFGIATFFDAGRMWTDLRNAHPELDGSGLGLHWGAGAGIRLQQGRAFLVRADLAWSPDARPIAGYVLADHIF
ncbi:MAG: BamA/TamA family outer membrane protein [Kofleriaceae bacterium]